MKNNIGFENFEENFYADPKTMFIVPKEKSIKIIYEDDVDINIDGDDIVITKKLSDVEAKKLLHDIFGTTDLGIIDKWNDIPEKYMEKLRHQGL